MRRGKARVTVGTAQGAIQDSFAAARGVQQWQEMMAASAITMGLRMVAIQQKFSRNEPQDLLEWNRMFSEKNAAWWQAGAAVVTWQQALFNFWIHSPLTQLTLLSVPQALALSGRLTGITLRGASGVMTPYHRRSTANAKRLSRKSR